MFRKFIALVPLMTLAACSDSTNPVTVSCTDASTSDASQNDAGAVKADAGNDSSAAADGGKPDAADDAGDASTDAGIDAGPVYPFTTVVTILLENHDYNEVVGNTQYAPYINSLINQYGLATNYLDSGIHPSLPNYVYLLSGQVHIEYQSDNDASWYLTNGPGHLLSDDNLGNQLEGAHVPWHGYFENMFAPCQITDTHDMLYATRHNPFVYFSNFTFAPNAACANRIVDYSNFENDLAAGQTKYMWISPNIIDDGHGIAAVQDPMPTLKASDDWCSANIPKILASNVFKAGGVIFLTWDEAQGRANPEGGTNSKDQVPMIVISPKLKSAGYRSNTPFSHASYLATIEDIFGLPRLGAAATATNLMEFFQ